MAIDVLPPSSILAAFLAASFVLAVTPGPGVVYIVACSVADGRRRGLASVVGVALGNLGNALGASTGLAVVFAVSAAAFTVIKYAGACYLMYLGVRMLLKADAVAKPLAIVPARLGRVVRDGFVVALLNPKTALFFAAFFPQFLPATTSLFQTAILGGIFVLVAAVTDTGYVMVAGAMTPVLARAHGRFKPVARYASAFTLVGLGLVTAFTPSRAAK